MKLLRTLLLVAVSALPFIAFAEEAQPQAAQADLTKGAATFATVCIACHGPDGNPVAPNFPRLAQQHPDYLLKQLHEFKEDKRVNPIMKGFASALSDEDMRNVVAWVVTQKAKDGASSDKDLVLLGERIYRGGIADRAVPACAGCHSPNGAGIPSQYPRLSGQQPVYVVEQLTAFRDGTRTNSLPMAQVTAKMNDREIKAVADYIAGLR